MKNIDSQLKTIEYESNKLKHITTIQLQRTISEALGNLVGQKLDCSVNNISFEEIDKTNASFSIKLIRNFRDEMVSQSR